MADYTMERPRFSAEDLDDEKQRKKIISWLIRLDEQLRYMMGNIGEENLNSELAQTISAAANVVQLVAANVEDQQATIQLLPDMIRIAVEGIDEFRTRGSTIVLTETQAKIATDEFSVEISSGADGSVSLQIDKDGSVMDYLTVQKKLIAPNVVQKYDGPDVLHVGGSELLYPDQYSSLQNALDQVNGKALHGDVTVKLHKDVYENVSLSGVTGYGQLLITGRYTDAGGPAMRAIQGWFMLDGCQARISLEGLDIRTASRYDSELQKNFPVLGFTGCSSVSVDHVSLSGTGSAYQVLTIDGKSSVSLNEVGVFGSSLSNAVGVYVGRNSDMHSINLKGSATYFLKGEGGRITMGGTRPAGLYSEAEPCLIKPPGPTSLTVDIGDGTDGTEPEPEPFVPPEPEQTTRTVTLNAVASDTYMDDLSSGNTDGWMHNGWMLQGYGGGAEHMACMWFNVSGIQSVNVESARLRVTRRAGYGHSSDVALHLYAIPYVAPSSSDTYRPDIDNAQTGYPVINYGVIGYIGQGETKEFSGSGVKSAASTLQLARGSYGLMLKAGDGAPVSGSSMGPNFCRFDGAADTNGPELIVSVYESTP